MFCSFDMSTCPEFGCSFVAICQFYQTDEECYCLAIKNYTIYQEQGF